MYVSMVCEPERFRPIDEVDRIVRWLDRDLDYELARPFWPPDVPLSRQDWEDAHAQGYRYCAIVHDGAIAALGAVWEYSEDRWEVAAVRTDPELRGRGYAKRVVSFATAHILGSGRIATCTTESGNVAMIRAAESVGFERA